MLLRTHMFRILFLLFIIIPIIEITVLMQVGEWLGAWPTVGIVIISAWLGATYVRQQGLQTLNTLQEKMAQGEMPSEEIVSGLLLIIAGVLLVTPGFVTDILGLALLLPSFRKLLLKSVQVQLAQKASHQSAYTFSHNSQIHDVETPFQKSESTKKETSYKGQTLDGEFERKD